MIAWINWEHVTLSGRVTVMVSIVTCGAPILQLPWLVPVPTPTDLQQNNISYSLAWSEVFMVGNIWFSYFVKIRCATYEDDVQNMSIIKKAHITLQTISSQFPDVAAL